MDQPITQSFFNLSIFSSLSNTYFCLQFWELNPTHKPPVSASQSSGLQVCTRISSSLKSFTGMLISLETGGCRCLTPTTGSPSAHHHMGFPSSLLYLSHSREVTGGLPCRPIWPTAVLGSQEQTLGMLPTNPHWKRPEAHLTQALTSQMRGD